jgi:hypothetical protein
MQTIIVADTTRQTLLAALDAHAMDHSIGVKIRRRDEDRRTIAATVAAWPADADGLFRIALPHRDLTILWRAWALAEIAAGRGARAAADEYAAKLNLTIAPDLTDAYDYVAARLAGSGVHGTNGSRTGWTQSAMWVLGDGETRKPYRRYEASGWRSRARAHDACAATGLALPGRNTWHPKATMLFLTPVEKLSPAQAVALTKEESDAIDAMMAA